MWMCYPALLRPATTAAGAWPAFGLRKDKIRGKALKDKRCNKIGKMLHRKTEREGE